ncbi:hypothetical protein GCM10016272_10320 [Psychrobacter glaciei]|uniref:Uncharacterized protein n=1 Tax=Psychrobacter glaciei TaxID=619771 RepID=A0ABQ3GP84_9GAMM|nr:hypothetical protein GCM10016272_10320 [Psychrobacter glaciei]
MSTTEPGLSVYQTFLMAEIVFIKCLLYVGEYLFAENAIFFRKKCLLGVDEVSQLGHNTEPKMAM